MAKDVIARLKTDTSHWNSGLNQATQAINKFKSDCLSTNNVIGGMAKSVTSMAASFVGPAAAVGALSTAFHYNVDTAKQFEKSVSELSSLTGMTGAALDDLKAKAIDLGGSTTQSASQVVDAFKLIGSQKPELLGNAKALNDVTKAAITLAEASGNDVRSSATALTASLNIMGEGADQAQRYINVLAAASQAGSVDIQGLTDIIFKSGQAASMNKLSFEEFIAVAEAIGPKFGTAAEAGTALNTMLLKLETQTNDKYKPSVVGLQEALNNLSEANMTAAQKTKLVTENGFKALEAILANTSAVGDLQDKITGTNTAIEQAKINTDNLDGALKNLESKWERLNLTINDGNGIFTGFVNLLGEGLTGATDTIQAIKDIGSAFSVSNEYVGAAVEGIKTYVSNLVKHFGGGGVIGQVIRNIRDFFDLGQSGGGKEEVEGDFSDDIFDRERWLENLKKKKYGNTTPTPSPTTTTKTKNTEITSTLDLDGAEDYTYKLYQQQTEDFQRRKAQEQFNAANPFVEKEVSLGSITDLDWYQQIQEQLNSNPLEIHLDVSEEEMSRIGEIATSASGLSTVQRNAQGAAQAFNALGQAMMSIENPAAKVAGTIAMAIANIAGGMAAMLAAPQSTSQSWGWIALAISATATMASTIAAIHQATGYAEGGIIKGASYTGDAVPIMANAGEIVLNASQQSNIASQLVRSSEPQTATSTISGEQIVTVINAYGRRTHRGEILI